jgi:hypothetical protein
LRRAAKNVTTITLWPRQDFAPEPVTGRWSLMRSNWLLIGGIPAGIASNSDILDHYVALSLVIFAEGPTTHRFLPEKATNSG